MLQEMFGDESVPKVFKGDKFVVTVDGKKANIDISALVTCALVTYIKFFRFLENLLFPFIYRKWNVQKMPNFNKLFKQQFLNYINLWPRKYNNLYYSK